MALTFSVRADEPPSFLSGPEGFFFVLVTDGKGQPVLANDGSPLYEGEKKVGSSLLKVSLSLKAIEKKLAAERSTPEARSDWVNSAIQVSVGQGLVEKFLEDYRGKPEVFLKLFSGMTRDKAEILRRILFEDRISLEVPLTGERQNEPGFVNLQALRRNARDPNPGKIKVRFPVEGTPWYITASSEWFVEVELDHLSFDFEDKMIEFDPVTNTFRITLNCKGAVIKGPTVQVGRWRELHKYSDGRHWYGSYHVQDNYLLLGEVGPLSLTLSLQLFKDASGYWRMKVVRPEARDDEPGVALIPRQNPAEVVLNYEKEVRDGKTGGMTKRQAFNLSDRILGVINHVVSDMLDDAFGSVLFPEDLAFHFALQNPFDFKDPGLAHLETRLSGLKVGGTDLSLFFDARLRGVKASDCLKVSVSPQIKVETRAPLKSLGDFRKNPWVLSTHRDPSTQAEQWQVPQASNSEFLIRLSPSLFDLLSVGGWMGGLMCAHSLWWWPRPGAIPPAYLSIPEPPKMQLADNALEFDVGGRMVVSKRISDPYPHFDELSSAELALQGRLRLENSSLEKKLTLKGLAAFRFPEDPGLENLARDILLGLYPGSDSEPRWTYDQLQKLMGKLPLKLENILFTTDEARLHFTWSAPKASESPAEVLTRSHEIPITQFTTDPSSFTQTTGAFAKISWKSNVDRAFYSWRWRSSADAPWSVWTAFEERTSVTLPVSKPGKYEFQVLGMNSYFQIEDYPKQFDFPVRSRGALIEGPGPETPGGGPVVTEGGSGESGSPSASKRASEPGAFGCALGGAGFSNSISVLLLGLAVLLLLLKKSVKFHRV